MMIAKAVRIMRAVIGVVRHSVQRGFARPATLRILRGMRLRIAIAGAGIGGLALATGLARAGHAVTVYDKFDRPAPVGSGLVVQPVGQEVLRWLGIDPAPLGARLKQLLGHEADSGRRVLDVSYGTASDLGLGVHRATLFDALLDAAQNAGARIESGCAVTGASDGRLTFAHGRSDPADLIVDAAGARSPLTPLRPKPLPFGALWSTVDWPEATDLSRDRLRQVYRRADKMLGVLPLGPVPGRQGPQAAIFWSLPATGHADWLQNGLAAWQDEAATLWPAYAPFAAQISQPDQMTMARYAHGTLAKPYGKGVIHIGDAAHCASPQLGQGANMALLDACALCRAIEATRGDTDLAALHYARARRAHVWAYQAMSRMFTPQFQSDSCVLPIIRDRILFPVSQVPPATNLLTRLVRGTLVPPLGSLAP